MIKVRSKVRFTDEDGRHEYWLGDKQLMGITGIIKTMVFPDKYSNIPDYIMERARQRGSDVHQEVEFIDTLGAEPTTAEGMNYVFIRDSFGFKHADSEYLVSDNERIATKIDKVYEAGDGLYILADIKTTSELDTEYLSWQLSTNAVLFERQAGFKVIGLRGIWLRGSDRAEVVEIERKSDAEVDDLYDRYFRGERPEETAMVVKDEPMPTEYTPLEEFFIEYDAWKKENERKEKEFKERLQLAMADAGDWVWFTDNVRITRIAEHTQSKVDTGTLKKKYPEIYAELLKDSPVKESIKITVKKSK